ncbi:des, partial [Symbiodinium sp. CCMP2456]
MALSFAVLPSHRPELLRAPAEGHQAPAASSQHAAQLVVPAAAAVAVGVTVRRQRAVQRLRGRHVSRAVAAAPAAPAPPELSEERRKIQALLKKWRADDGEAWQSLALTAFLYVFSVAAVHLSAGSWPAIVLLAFSLVRSFIVFHDAAHPSFFEKAEDNKLLGQVLQFFVNYSMDEWNQIHNSHHNHFGDNTVKDNSLTIWFCEEELKKGPWWKWFLHRLIRDP